MIHDGNHKYIKRTANILIGGKLYVQKRMNGGPASRSAAVGGPARGALAGPLNKGNEDYTKYYINIIFMHMINITIKHKILLYVFLMMSNINNNNIGNSTCSSLRLI